MPHTDPSIHFSSRKAQRSMYIVTSVNFGFAGTIYVGGPTSVRTLPGDRGSQYDSSDAKNQEELLE